MNEEKSLNEMLSDEIGREFEALGDTEVGSEEYKSTVDGLVKLIDRAIEIDKIQVDSDNKAEERESNAELKTKQMKDENTDRWIRNGIAAAGIIIPTLVTIWGAKKTFEFEETGTVTTMIGRGFVNKLLPKK